MSSGAAERVAAGLLALARRRSPTLGAGRLLCLDGPGGAGKTTLASAVERAHGPGAVVVHMDDLYDGWTGLATVAGQLDSLLGPLSGGRPGCYRRYDWHARGFAETVLVDPPALLVLEGVGSGSTPAATVCTVLAWVEAPRDVRLARGLARDGEALREEWRRWQDREEAHFAREQTRRRAEVLVDGTGSAPPVLLSRPVRARE